MPPAPFHRPDPAHQRQGSGSPGCLAWVSAGSALGSRCFFAGTAGTTVDNRTNPLSSLRKSVPAGCGDKPKNSGDSGDNSFRVRPRAFGPSLSLVPGAPESRHCSAKEAPAPHRLPAARPCCRRVIGQAQKSRAGCDSSGSAQGPASGVCSRRTGPCRGSGSHAPTARGKPCHDPRRRTLRP